MLTVERFLFGFLIVSPIIAIIAFIAKSNSTKQNPDNNNAYYYSFWTLLFTVGILFDVFSISSAPNGDIAKGFLRCWNLLAVLNPLVYLGFVIGCFWGFTTLNTNKENKDADEVAYFMIKIFGSILISAVCNYLLQIILVIVNQIK